MTTEWPKNSSGVVTTLPVFFMMLISCNIRTVRQRKFYHNKNTDKHTIRSFIDIFII